MILLRFRDISIPDGQTIEQHNDISFAMGHVWWGWIRRAQENFPKDFLVNVSRQLENSNEQILLLHTDFSKFYQTNLKMIHAHLDGRKALSPQEECTPRYMHGNPCSAWFHLTKIEPTDFKSIKKVVDLPTLPNPREADKKLLNDTPLTAIDFKASDATLWVVEI